MGIDDVVSASSRDRPGLPGQTQCECRVSRFAGIWSTSMRTP